MSDYDLTALDKPLGEYPDAVIGALVRAAWEAPERLEYRDGIEWLEDFSSHKLRLDLAYRLAPEPPRPMSPPWDVLPEWVQAVTRDKNGSVYIFDQIPECDDAYQWLNVGDECVCITSLRFDRGNLPWRESLVLRPEGV